MSSSDVCGDFIDVDDDCAESLLTVGKRKPGGFCGEVQSMGYGTFLGVHLNYVSWPADKLQSMYIASKGVERMKAGVWLGGVEYCGDGVLGYVEVLESYSEGTCIKRHKRK